MSEVAQAMRAALVAARNQDGGWPYFKGKASRLEPTVFALLATNELDGAVLDRWQRRDSFLVDAAGEINFAFNGQAAMLYSLTRSARRAELANALTVARGVRIPPSTINRQDNSIQAWSWSQGTFSWVESTAWCLLGLKKLAAAPRSDLVNQRLEDGRRLLDDRVCQGGGWNDGNSNMLGRELPPYVSTTALALLALRDEPLTRVVTGSLDYLERHRTDEQGGLALALTRVCLGVYGRGCSEVDAALESEWRRSRFLSNVHVTALALYALSGDQGYEAFHV